MGALRPGGSVTPGPSSVGSSQITDGSVASADLADSAVTTAKIAGQAVTLANIDRTGADSGKVLTGNGAGSSPSWETPAASTPTTTRGDMIVRGASADVRLAIGPAGRALVSDGTDPAWTAITAASIGAEAASSAALPSTGLLIHLVADDLSAGAVSSWASRVGGYAAVQATGSKQPVCIAGGFAGRNCVRFDGSDDFLEIVNAVALDFATFALFVAFRNRANTSGVFPGNGLLVGRVHSTNSGTAPYYRWAIRDSSVTACWRTAEAQTTTMTVPYGRLDQPSLAHLRVGTAVSGYGSWDKLNGVHLNASSPTTVTYPDAQPINLGGAGAYSVPANFFYGDIAEVAIYAGVTQTAAVRQQVESYFSAKYRIAMGASDFG